jgi:hypothetical protein
MYFFAEIPAPGTRNCRLRRRVPADDVKTGEILDLDYILGLGAFAAFDDLELHLLAFLQGPKTLALDIAVVYEDIGAVFLGNKSIPLGITEPLYLTFSPHSQILQTVLPRQEQNQAFKKKERNDR